MSDRYVALLRGVNVGGNHKLPMKDLAALCEELGATDVQTFIQSGNVVLGATPALAEALPDRLAAAIETKFGFPTPVVVRSAADMARIVRANPFPDAGPDDPLNVMFLADRPDPAAVASLDPDRSPPDRFAVVGSEIYLLLGNGVAKSKLTNAWFDSRLKTVGTTRNWRTTLKLLELASA